MRGGLEAGTGRMRQQWQVQVRERLPELVEHLEHRRARISHLEHRLIHLRTPPHQTLDTELLSRRISVTVHCAIVVRRNWRHLGNIDVTQPRDLLQGLVPQIPVPRSWSPPCCGNPQLGPRNKGFVISN